MKLAGYALLLLFATAVFGFTQQATAPPENPDAAALREEIRTIEKLLPQLPDRAPALFELAHDYALLGDLRKSMAFLRECASLHEGFNPQGDAALARLTGDPEFKVLVEQVHHEFPQVQRARLAFTIPESDLIPEGLAVDPNQHFFYMGSLSRKKIVKISPAGLAIDFFPSGRYDVQSICGIKVDPDDENVWANTCPDNGKGAELLRFDGAGKLLERFSQSTAGPHLFNDLVLRNRDEIYLTDSLAHQALRFDRKTHAFTALAFPRPLYYPNGIALSGDGNLLYVADAFGVLQYDLRNQKSREVQPGPSNTISGFDGLYWYQDSLVGIQNSMGLPRAARFQLSRDGSRVTAATILEYRTGYVEMPTTGAIDGDNFYFMSNTQINNWKNEQIVNPTKLAGIKIAVIHLD